MIRHNAGLAAVALAMAGLVTSATAQERYPGVDDLPNIELRMGDSSAPGSPQGKSVQDFVDFVAEQSKGKIKIEVFWSSSLYPPMEAANSIGSGTVDLGSVFAHFRPSDFPVANWIQIIGVRSQGGNPLGSMLPTAVAMEFFATSPEIAEEMAGHNLILLGGSGSDAYDMLCTSPIANLADAKGRRTRTGTTTLARQAAALGMVATPLDITEAYEAFSRGIIDCGNMEINTYINTGMVEAKATTYWTPVHLTGLFLPGYGMNLDKWNSLPPVAQKIIRDGVAVQSMSTLVQKMVVNRQFGDLIKAGKVKPIQPAEDLQAAAQAFNQAELASMGQSAPAGVENPQAIVDQLNGLFDKWHGIITGELGFAPLPEDVNGIVESWYRDYDFSALSERISQELR